MVMRRRLPKKVAKSDLALARQAGLLGVKRTTKVGGKRIRKSKVVLRSQVANRLRAAKRKQRIAMMKRRKRMSGVGRRHRVSIKGAVRKGKKAASTAKRVADIIRAVRASQARSNALMSVASYY